MKGKKSLIGLMVLFAAGAVTTGALAFEKVSDSKNIEDQLDSAIYLYWDSNSTTKVISPVNNLAQGVPQYRALTVSPKGTSSVTGTVTLSFAAVFEKNYSAKGLQIQVNEAETVEKAEAGVYKSETPVATLNCNTVTYSTTETVNAEFTADPAVTIAVTAGTATAKIYSITFTYTNTEQDSGYQFGGKMSISQSFLEA